MLKSYPRNLKDNFSVEYINSYHCHFALKDLLNNLIKINFLGLTHYQHNSSSIIIKIDTFSLKLPIPVTAEFLRHLSTSIYRFTNAKELTLYKVLLENTSLTKLKVAHCTRCSQVGICKAFFMSDVEPS